MSVQTYESAVFCVFIYLIVACDGISAQDLMCCSHTTGSCRSVCEKVSQSSFLGGNGLCKLNGTGFERNCFYRGAPLERD
ncbi:hypothetical protein Zmor_023130 [Zophobas morio]|uniref:Uncharacterized protein n=1 Tax=Zophobas morio TaxID=2755281 RepID=A0AA38HXB8_9CUCU|nr:hypothetical protein Zmor_023130 [Zophobas morio]